MSKTKIMENIQIHGKRLNAAKVSQVLTRLASSLTNPSAECIGSMETLPDYVRMSFAYEGILIDLSVNAVQKGGEV